MHPFTGFVTVTVYVPATPRSVEDAFGVVPAGFPDPSVHANVAPGVDELALTVTVGIAHVSVCAAPGVTFGVPVFELMVMFAVPVQPFDGSVTVTVYEPAALTVGVAVFPPLTIPGPLQEYDGLLTGVDAVNVPLVVVHVMVSAELADALGAVVLLLTFTVDVPVHPFEGSVTVTVYVPAAFTVGVCVEPPLTMPGPLHEYDGLEIPVLAEMVPEVVVQFNAKAEPPVTLGGVVFEVTLTLAVFEHPLAVLVTVTV